MDMKQFFTISATAPPSKSDNTNVWRRLLNADHAYLLN